MPSNKFNNQLNISRLIKTFVSAYVILNWHCWISLYVMYHTPSPIETVKIIIIDYWEKSLLQNRCLYVNISSALQKCWRKLKSVLWRHQSKSCNVWEKVAGSVKKFIRLANPEINIRLVFEKWKKNKDSFERYQCSKTVQRSNRPEFA